MWPEWLCIGAPIFQPAPLHWITPLEVRFLVQQNLAENGISGSHYPRPDNFRTSEISLLKNKKWKFKNAKFLTMGIQWIEGMNVHCSVWRYHSPYQPLPSQYINTITWRCHILRQFSRLSINKLQYASILWQHTARKTHNLSS